MQVRAMRSGISFERRRGLGADSVFSEPMCASWVCAQISSSVLQTHFWNEGSVPFGLTHTWRMWRIWSSASQATLSKLCLDAGTKKNSSSKWILIVKSGVQRDSEIKEASFQEELIAAHPADVCSSCTYLTPLTVRQHPWFRMKFRSLNFDYIVLQIA